MKSIDLVYFNAGGGHRSAAVALDAVIREHVAALDGAGWSICSKCSIRRMCSARPPAMKPEHYYNARLARGWTLGLGQELKVLQALIRLSHKSLTSQLQRHWQKTQPGSGRVAGAELQSRHVSGSRLRRGRDAPYVTILTDFADLPPHFWIEPHQAQHLICGTAKARRARRAPRATTRRTFTRLPA